jgi:cobaltochelatase CobS
MSYNALAKEIYPLCDFKFEDNGDSGSDKIEDIVKEIQITDVDNWTMKGKDVRHAFDQYVRNENPGMYEAIKKRFDKTFYRVLDLVPPFAVLFVASGQVSMTKFVEVMMNAPVDAEIIPNFIEEEKFVKALWSTYRHWKAFQSGHVVVDTEKSGIPVIPTLSPEKRTTLDHVLTSLDMPKWTDVESFIKSTSAVQAKLASEVATIKVQSEADIAKLSKERDEAITAITRITKELAAKPFEDAKVVGDGTIPNGKITMQNVGKVFPDLKKLNFDVPVWEWDGPHPDVPRVDPNYIFREELLVRALHAVITNQRMYLQGHTGSGKTTLIEQIAAHLNWPFMRINFDSEITRMDLIGRDTLQDGKSVFVDGMLPRAMAGPYICAFDELDFCRPDVSYVMQSALEGNGLNITEDGGRVVKPHEQFRMFGTGNTVGQGDEHGMYQGARPQSLAFLDRFTIWAKVPYLAEKERKALLKSHYPALSDEESETITKYSTEHLTAFEQSKVLQPISPRGILAIANALTFLNGIYPSDRKNIHRALTQTIVDRATEADAAVLKGLVDRVSKGS